MNAMNDKSINHMPSISSTLPTRRKKEIADVLGNKPMKNDPVKMAMSKEAKQIAWTEHYERLLNV